MKSGSCQRFEGAVEVAAPTRGGGGRQRAAGDPAPSRDGGWRPRRSSPRSTRATCRARGRLAISTAAKSTLLLPIPWAWASRRASRTSPRMAAASEALSRMPCLPKRRHHVGVRRGRAGVAPRRRRQDAGRQDAHDPEQLTAHDHLLGRPRPSHRIQAGGSASIPGDAAAAAGSQGAGPSRGAGGLLEEPGGSAGEGGGGQAQDAHEDEGGDERAVENRSHRRVDHGDRERAGGRDGRQHGRPPLRGDQPVDRAAEERRPAEAGGGRGHDEDDAHRHAVGGGEPEHRERGHERGEAREPRLPARPRAPPRATRERSAICPRPMAAWTTPYAASGHPDPRELELVEPDHEPGDRGARDLVEGERAQLRGRAEVVEAAGEEAQVASSLGGLLLPSRRLGEAESDEPRERHGHGLEEHGPAHAEPRGHDGAEESARRGSPPASPPRGGP